MNNDIIDDKEYVINELKRYPSNLDTINPIYLGYSLSDRLKNNPEIIKMIMESVYSIDFEDREYSLKELYMKYIEFYESCLPDIYFLELDLTRILPENWKDDPDICEFVKKYYVDVETVEDKSNAPKYDEETMKMLDEWDSKIKDDSPDKIKKSFELYLKFFSYLKMTKEYRKKAIESILEYLDYGISSMSIIHDVEYINKYSGDYHLSRCYKYIGNTYLKEREFDKAIFYYDEAIEVFPYYHSPYIGKTDALVKLDKIDEAIDYLNKVLNDQSINGDKKIFKAASKVNYDNRVLAYTYKSFIKKIDNQLKKINELKKKGYHYKPRI